MTNRTRGSLTPYETSARRTYQGVDAVDPPYTPFDHPAGLLGDNGSYMSDHVSKNYAKRIANGEIINNAMNYGILAVSEGNGTITYKNLSVDFRQIDSGQILSLYDGGYIPAVQSESASVSTAKLNALANMDPTPFSFGEDLGELGLMLSTMKAPLGSASTLAGKFKKLINKYTRSGLTYGQAFAKAWLMYRFLFRPLVESASDALEAYRAKMPEYPPRLTARGTGTETTDLNESTTISTGSVRTVSGSDSVTARASIMYTASDPMVGFRQQLGLRNKDIPRTLWDLFPYSFMVDRLTSIGTSISALTNLSDPSLAILATSVSVKRKTHYSRSLSVNYAAYPHSSVGSTGVRAISNDIYTRVPDWKPVVSDTIPGFHPGKVVDDASKVADLIALILVRL